MNEVLLRGAGEVDCELPDGSVETHASNDIAVCAGGTVILQNGAGTDGKPRTSALGPGMWAAVRIFEVEGSVLDIPMERPLNCDRCHDSDAAAAMLPAGRCPACGRRPK